MSIPTTIELDNGEIDYIYCGYEDVGCFLDMGELMQSTGLFDKKGVEIFEGDVVSILVEDSEEFAHSQVTFSMGGLGVTLDGDFVPFGALPLMAQVEYSLEVIGNIYENPELVKSYS